MAAEDQLIPNAQCADCLTDVHAFRSENGNTLLADVTPFSEADGEGRCLVVIGSQMVSAIYADVADRHTTFHGHFWHCERKVKS